jgi:adenylate cyclase
MLRKTQSALKARHGLLIALTILLSMLVVYFSAPDLFELAELRLLDWRTRLRGPKDPGGLVKLILLDSRSRERFGMDEGMRKALAGIIKELCDGQVRAIGLDVLFIPMRNGETDPSASVLSVALKECENVVMGYGWKSDTLEPRLGIAEAIGRRRLLDATRNPEEKGFTPENIPPDAVVSDPAITRNAAAVGFFTVSTDPFNTARKIPAALRQDDILFYPFSLAIVRMYLHESGQVFPQRSGLPIIAPYLEGANLAPDPTGYLWLDQYGTADAFQKLRFEDAVSNGIPPGFAKGSIVLIGVSGEDSNDQFTTSFDPKLPGVAIHATAVANALSGGFLWRDGLVRAIEVAFMAACALLMGPLLSRLHPSIAICLGPILILVLWMLGNRLLEAVGMWIQFVCPVLLILLTHIGILTARMQAAESRPSDERITD